MKKMKLFVDTHHHQHGTFPRGIGREDFASVIEKYEAACHEEGVVVMRALVNSEEGCMFCINLAPSSEAVRRAHEKVGLSFDSITEVTSAAPSDLFFQWK